MLMMRAEKVIILNVKDEMAALKQLVSLLLAITILYLSKKGGLI